MNRMQITKKRPSRRFLGIAAGLLAMSVIYSAQLAAEPEPEENVVVTSLRSEASRSGAGGSEHSITQMFFVESTSSVLNLSCAASDMQLSRKSGKDSGYNAHPLAADAARGCRIEVPGAISTIDASHSRIAQFDSGRRSAGEYQSDYVTFESLDGAAFAQDVYVTLFWKQRSDMQVSGEYQGTVKLLAEIPKATDKPK